MSRGLLQVCNLNCRSICSKTRLLELEEALMKINFDVVGLCETWRKGNGQELLTKSGSLLLYSGGNYSRRGVGFIVAPHLVTAIHRFTPISDRCCVLELRHQNWEIKLVQGYAPTSEASDNEYQTFLQSIRRACNSAGGPLWWRRRKGLPAGTGSGSKSSGLANSGQCNLFRNHRRCTVLMGDFNAAVGQRAHPLEPAVGIYGYGTRNPRGNQLVNFCSLLNLKVASSFRKQRMGRKWTWRSPNGATRKEYDLFLVQRTDIVRSVCCINQFDFRSDHRLCRMTLDIDACVPRRRPPMRTTKLNWPLYKHTIQELKEAMNDDDPSAQYQGICETINLAKEIATEDVPTPARISPTTRDLYSQRRLLLAKDDPISRLQLVQLNKALRMSLASDIEKRLFLRYQQTLASRRLFEDISTPVMWQLLKDDGSRTQTLPQLKERVKEFFNKLYERSTMVHPDATPLPYDVPPVLNEEVWKQLRHMKKRTAPGIDSITTLMLRAAEDELVPYLAHLFTRMLELRVFPPAFSDSITTLIPKKGDLADLTNYRPISVLPAPYKLFTRVILARIQGSLEYNQPEEQAGFRRNYSTVEHLHTVRQLIDKAYDYHNHLYLVFVDFRKAYDTLEWNAVWNSLHRHGVEPLYVEMLRQIYTEAGNKIKVQKETVDVNIQRGVRQGCVLSPLLFNAVLEEIFRQLDWDGLGVTINGRTLNHLRYADDVVLVGRSLQAVQRMVTELEMTSRRVGLEINRRKTVAMTNAYEGNLLLNGEPITFVRHFVYLGCDVTCTRENQELSRRIGAGWAAFNRHRTFLTRRTVPMKMKRRVFLTCVVPSLLYGCEIWSLKRDERRKLSTVQRRMERAMLGLSLLDRVPNDEVRRRTGMPDILDIAWLRKLRWSSRLASMEDGRWSKATTEWYPRDRRRYPGRREQRWEDDLSAATSSLGWEPATWMRRAREGATGWIQDMRAARHLD